MTRTGPAWTNVRAAALCSTAMLLCAGCGDPAELVVCPCADSSAPDTAPDVQPDSPAEDIDTFCDAALGRAASAYETCCTDADKETWPYRTGHGLAAAVAWECKDKLAASVARGRIALDAAAMDSCAQAANAAYDAAGCGIFVTGFGWEASRCRDAVGGLQPLGAPCRYRYECAAGLICDGYREGVDGACVEPPTNTFCLLAELAGSADDILDSLFGVHPPCEPGFSCLHTDQYGVCAPVVGAGGHCVSTPDCDTGLTCHAGICGDAGPSAEGGACRVSADCVAGLYCLPPAQAGADGTCALRKAGGEFCTGTPADECAGLCGAGVCGSFCGSL